MEQLLVVRLGLVGYEEGVRMQRALERARADGEVADVVLMLEHPPVYTRGRRSTPAELPMGEDWYRMQGIEVVQADRGGRGDLPRPRAAGRLPDHGPARLLSPTTCTSTCG